MVKIHLLATPTGGKAGIAYRLPANFNGLCSTRLVDMGRTHGLTHSTEYNSWANMWQRCTNIRHPKYPSYGGRGIKVCERWIWFEHFYEDMGPKPEDHSIERINNDGDYEPSNCVWADNYTQAINKSISSRNKVGCNGVKWDKDRHKWRAGITRRGERVDLGLFTELEDAVAARKAAEYQLDLTLAVAINGNDRQSAKQ